MAKNKNKKRGFIVDKKKSNTPYHLKKRHNNIADNWFAKVIIVLMILAFVVGPVAILISYLVTD